jgi:hypothetical protein
MARVTDDLSDTELPCTATRVGVLDLLFLFVDGTAIKTALQALAAAAAVVWTW